MRKVAWLMSAAVALGLVAGVVPGTAMAAKKDKEAAAPKGPVPILSKEFRAAVAPLQTAEAAKDAAGLEAGIAAATPFAKSPDELFFLGNYTLVLGKLKNDNVTLIKGVDQMIDSNSALASPNIEVLLINSARAAYQGGNYEKAIARLAQMDARGSKDINRLLLSAEANFKLNRFAPGLMQLDRAITEGKASGAAAADVDSWAKRGLNQALRTKDTALVGTWSTKLVMASPTRSNWRDALIVFRDAGKLDKESQLDIARLMRETGSLTGEKDFVDYASMALENKSPWEAKAVLELGQKSGSVPASSRALTERLAEANSMLAVETTAIAGDVKRATATGTAAYATNVANALIAQGDNAKALDLLAVAEKRPGANAAVISMLRGIALTRLGRKDEARTSFAAVTGDSSKAQIARFWTMYLDIGAPVS